MIRPFGTLRDGRAVECVQLGDEDSLRAEVLTYGGLLHRLTLPAKGRRCDLVLTLPTIDAYERDPSFLGVLVGRFGNRIAGSRFTLDGKEYRLNTNEPPNHLHGGSAGFGKQLWTVREATAARVVLQRRSAEGEQGYPGNLDVTASIDVAPAELRLTFEAICDRATPLNLTYHPYFNLCGDLSRRLDDHTLRIAASGYLPVADRQLIPTGEIASVQGTPFDFRTARKFSDADVRSSEQLGFGGGYDHCWVLDERRDCDAELSSAMSGITMRVSSDRPGLQFYGGQGLPTQHPQLNGICLEPQGFPDAVNQPRFPPAILRAGVPFRTQFRYVFAV